MRRMAAVMVLVLVLVQEFYFKKKKKQRKAKELRELIEINKKPFFSVFDEILKEKQF